MAEPAGKPSFGLSAACLAGLGAFFYASYGFTNWLAAQRTQVPSIVFSWESGVPFVAWTIVPYWTTNFFYAASLFLCRTRAEFFSHVKRLLTAQIVSVFFFIVTPLKFSWPKPDTSGAFGFLFDTLGAFDKPFNQAPSLHIALTVILGALYLKILPRWARLRFALWSALVVASVMTTFQHHFIDIPTGLLLGLFCVWLWPADGSRRIENRGISRGRRRILACRYGFGAALFAGAGLALDGGFLWLLWPGFSLFCVALAYLWLGTAIFDKAPDGRLAWPARLLLWPHLAAAWLNSRFWTRGEPRTVDIADGVFLGRFPSSMDLKPFATVIDLTSEFSKPLTAAHWRSFPMLDLAAPPPTLLAAAADSLEQARPDGPVLVVCALGYGRSVSTLAAWLVRTGRQPDAAAALDYLRLKRPRLSVTADQLLSIKEAIDVKTDHR